MVAQLRELLERHGTPRIEVFLLVSLAGFAGFLISFALLTAGLTSMPVRYGISAAGGYVAFLALLGIYARTRMAPDLGLVADLADPRWLDLPVPRSTGGVARFSGGQSGGGGASASWGAAAGPRRGGGSSSGGSWLDGDSDSIWLIVAAVAAAAAIVAVGYVVWAAPALLAEVLVDAAIVSTVSKQLAPTDRRDWTATALRRTWLPAAVVIITVTIAGWALQKAAPDAPSIGPAIRQIVN